MNVSREAAASMTSSAPPYNSAHPDLFQRIRVASLRSPPAITQAQR
jgi:hypothetical protein